MALSKEEDGSSNFKTLDPQEINEYSMFSLSPKEKLMVTYTSNRIHVDFGALNSSEREDVMKMYDSLFPELSRESIKSILNSTEVFLPDIQNDLEKYIHSNK